MRFASREDGSIRRVAAWMNQANSHLRGFPTIDRGQKSMQNAEELDRISFLLLVPASFIARDALHGPC